MKQVKIIAGNCWKHHGGCILHTFFQDGNIYICLYFKPPTTLLWVSYCVVVIYQFVWIPFSDIQMSFLFIVQTEMEALLILQVSMTLNISGDLQSLFTWNTKQVLRFNCIFPLSFFLSYFRTKVGEEWKN